jgi:hypothetical protein
MLPRLVRSRRCDLFVETLAYTGRRAPVVLAGRAPWRRAPELPTVRAFTVAVAETLRMASSVEPAERPLRAKLRGGNGGGPSSD